jgi:hypothetical protein
MHTNFWDGSRWVDESTSAAAAEPQSGLRQLTRRVVATAASGTLVAALAAGLLASPALAGKPSGGSTTGASLSVVMVVDANANGLPNWNDTITFAVTTSASTPVVVLNCSQGSTGVYTAQAGFYPSYAWPANYRLSSTMWTGGAASCVATLESYGAHGKYTQLSTLKFTVGA